MEFHELNPHECVGLSPQDEEYVLRFVGRYQEYGEISSRWKAARVSLERGLMMVRSVKAGEVIWEHGGRADFSFGVLEGAVKVELPEGESALLALVLPGEIGGLEYLLDPPQHFGRAVALTKTRLLIGGEASLRFFFDQTPEFLVLMMRHSAEMLAVSRHRIAALTSGLADQRLGRLLLILVDRVGVASQDGGTMLGLRLTRSDLANLIGCRRETVARTLNEWGRRGWLKLEGRRIHVVERAAIEAHVDWRSFQFGGA